jgi:hypothetical protein
MLVPRRRAFSRGFLLAFFTLFYVLREFQPLLRVQQLHRLGIESVKYLRGLLESMFASGAQLGLRILK